MNQELSRLTNNKYTEVIRVLCNYEVFPNSDNDYLPNYKDLASKLNYSIAKTGSILKKMLADLISEFISSPLEIKQCVHHIHIHLPYDEMAKLRKDVKSQFREESTWIQMVLPVTPRIGEEIELPFILETGKNYHGYVHNVRHKITGSGQEIFVEAHPSHDFYYKWEKMKNEHDDRQRWLMSLRNQ